jgi:hypothetical protein
MRSIALLLAFALATVAAEDKPNKSTPQGRTVVTGCVDQRGQDFMLVYPAKDKEPVVLRARGFSDDNFARFVGKKAEVAGELKTGEDGRQILHVTKIDKIAETCH